MSATARASKSIPESSPATTGGGAPGRQVIHAPTNRLPSASHWYRNFAKMFWEDPSEHLARSPLMYVGNVSTPTMLMTGVKDLRTPIAQTEEYYQALKMLKVPTAMVRFNDEFHGTSSKPSNFLRTQLYLRYWFEKHTTDSSSDPTATAGN